MTTSIPGGETATPLTPLDPTQASASAIIQSQLQQWGLESLSSVVNDLIRQGYGTDAITLQLEQTPEYKQRFAANDARQKAGLPVLSPAEYIATERSYRQVLQQYGLPSGFWDQPSDFQTLLANDMSPDELKTRAQDAQAVYLNADPFTRQAFAQMFGGSAAGAGIAAILDPDTALPIIQRMTAASQIGGAALANGLGVDADRFQQYADQGVTQAQADKAFGQIGQTFDTDKQIAARFGNQWSQANAEQATLLGNGPASKQQAAMYDAEKQLFNARGSADQNTTSTRATGSY